MTLKSANIKSTREFIERVMGGEVFYIDEYRKVFFDQSFPMPFRVYNEKRNDEVSLYRWEVIPNLLVKTEWYEDIPKEGKLCWVSDKDRDEKARAMVIKSYKPERELCFIDAYYGSPWRYATPVTEEDL